MAPCIMVKIKGSYLFSIQCIRFKKGFPEEMPKAEERTATFKAIIWIFNFAQFYAPRTSLCVYEFLQSKKPNLNLSAFSFFC